MGDSRWWSARSQRQAAERRDLPSRIGNPMRQAARLAVPRVAVPRRGTPEYDRRVVDGQMRQSDDLRRARRIDDAAPRAQGPYGTGMSYLDPNTPNIYGPLAEIATAAIETPDYVRALLGDAAAARYIAGQPARALDMSRGMRSVGEFLIGPEEVLGMADRLGTGQGDALDAILLPLTVMPGPIGKAAKRLGRAAANRLPFAINLRPR